MTTDRPKIYHDVQHNRVLYRPNERVPWTVVGEIPPLDAPAHVMARTPDGRWVPASPVGWREEHSPLARALFWLRGRHHCCDREGQHL